MDPLTVRSPALYSYDLMSLSIHSAFTTLKSCLLSQKTSSSGCRVPNAFYVLHDCLMSSVLIFLFKISAYCHCLHSCFPYFYFYVLVKFLHRTFPFLLHAVFIFSLPAFFLRMQLLKSTLPGLSILLTEPLKCTESTCPILGSQ